PFDSFDERLERTRRVDAESVRTGSEYERVEFGIGRGCRGQLVRGGGGVGDGRVDRVALCDEFTGGDQTYGWAREQVGHHSDFDQPGYGGADGANGCGCGGVAECAGGRG